MKTPIADFAKQYANSGVARFHMPGHKGVPHLGCEPYDLTEIDGADVLSQACGIIAESENNATALFDTAHTYYSTEGSTLCIKAMLRLVTQNMPRATRPRILAARNAHKAFVYAAALLDLDVEWLYPEAPSHLCSCVITSAQVADALKNAAILPAAVYLTSPDYLGQIADLAAIAGVCDLYGVPLLVDNAHGAYLQFLKPSQHPIALGAAMCCDSAHKTLPALTGGAYLHVSKKAPSAYLNAARDAMALFASTSPSYLILQSLDLCNRYLANDYQKELCELTSRMTLLRKALRQQGIAVIDSEPLKLVLRAAAFGYTGDELAVYLRERQMECEFSDAEYLVLMLTPQNSDDDLQRLSDALFALPLRQPLPQAAPLAPTPHTACTSIREAILSPHEILDVRDAVGRILATPTVSCPPAIPIVISGERITCEDVTLFDRYGISSVAVVRK